MSGFGNGYDTLRSPGVVPNPRVYLTAVILAGIVTALSSFHFWPLEGHRLWEIAVPANAAVLLWAAVAGLWCISKRQWTFGRGNLPPVSLLAYVCIMIMSIAFALDTARALVYAGKLALVVCGGYTLFACAAWGNKGRQVIHVAACLAAALAVGCCLAVRVFWRAEVFGFFRSSYKYGTYLGMLVPLCGSWLMLAKFPHLRLMGGLLVIAAIVSAGTLGCVVAISVGLAAAALLAPRWPSRLTILAVMVAALLLVCLWPGELTAPLRRDAAICEADGINVRQRYIQWQAFINLLEGRSIAGTGAGCVNEHRSAFYYRLPKLNTLAPFDENGYLATAAEGGILALACLGWVIVNHFSMAWGRIVRARRCNDPEESRLSIAASAAVVGACAANVFSSVQYNGILVIFVAVLALTPAAGSGTGAVQRD